MRTRRSHLISVAISSLCCGLAMAGVFLDVVTPLTVALGVTAAMIFNLRMLLVDWDA